MIKIKTDKEIEYLRKAGEITKNTLLEIEKHIKPGVTTRQLDKIAYDFILKNNVIFTSTKKFSYISLYNNHKTLSNKKYFRVFYWKYFRYVV